MRKAGAFAVLSIMACFLISCGGAEPDLTDDLVTSDFPVAVSPEFVSPSWVISSRSSSELVEYVSWQLLENAQQLMCDRVSSRLMFGSQPCSSTRDAASVNVFLNKEIPLEPLEYEPEGLRSVQINGGHMLRDDAASALEQLAAAAFDEGAGRIASSSGYRSYELQAKVYRDFLTSKGQEWTEQQSAKPGHSEHQTGLAVDVVACGSYSCGSIYDFEGTSQQQWVAENAHRFGFIVRYPSSEIDVTGYTYEPWHLRFVGHENALKYHSGGFKSWEAFLGY